VWRVFVTRQTIKSVTWQRSQSGAARALNTSLLSVDRALTRGGGLPQLEHLNLSGCLTVTGAGLQDLVSACPSLNDEHFYYCDNINGNVFL